MGQFTIYKSTDSSAPALANSNGSIVTVFDACLVNGYGAKSAAGWTKAFTGTNKAAYRQASAGSGGQQFYVRIQDDGPNNVGEARATGYETMSAVDVGTNPFPTALQGLTATIAAVCIRKNNTSTTNPPWILVADGRTLYFFMAADGSGNGYTAFAFGDFYSFVANDPYRCMIIGRDIEATASNSHEGLELNASSLTTASLGHFIARNYAGHSGLLSVTANKHGDIAKSGGSTFLIGAVPNTNSADSNIYLAPLWLCEPITSTVRGRLRGLWHFCHAQSTVSDGDTVSGLSSDLAGKTFTLVKRSPNNAVYAVESSNTVDTN